MGYIICKIHGGNVVSLVSDYHAKKIIQMQDLIDSELLKVHVFDKKEFFSGRYIVDPILVAKIGIKASKIDINSEFKQYQMMLENMSPVCSKCLDNYLK